MSAVAITEKHLAIVKQILHAHLPMGTRVWVFGSRATGKAKNFMIWTW